MLFPFCWWRGLALDDGTFLEFCRVGVFLYIIMRLLSSIVTFVHEVGGAHPRGSKKQELTPSLSEADH